jgi:hypothetical protein
VGLSAAMLIELKDIANPQSSVSVMEWNADFGVVTGGLDGVAG